MKTLFLTFAYPPLKFPRSIQISHLVQHLKKHIFITVLTSSPNKTTEDMSLLEFTPLDNVILTERSRFARWMENIKGYKIKKALFPDFHYWWSRDLYKMACKVMSSEINTIITFGQPMSTHIAGYKLKRKFPRLKWIAHFSDPWVDNPYNDYNAWVRFVNKKFQGRVFNLADKLVFTSPETINLVMRNYSNVVRSKAIYLPHSFNSNLYSSISRKQNKFLIRHLGNFYGPRQPDSLFKALALLKNSGILPSDLLIELVGAPKELNNVIKQYKLENTVFVKTPINFLNSLDLMLQSDLLLVIDAPAIENVFFPSKLADYIGANRPIFGITSRGTSKKILEELGFSTADPNNSDEIAKKMIEMINNIKEGKSKTNQEVRQQYSISVVGDKLLQIINSLTKRDSNLIIQNVV